MESYERPTGSLHFTFAGVPTTIYPSTWLVLLVLGSSGSRGHGTDLLPVLSFIIAGVLCLLVHEYGHALSCRALGGSPSRIILATMGGVTLSDRTPSSRLGSLLMTLAGPGASLLLGALAGLILGLQVGDAAAGVLFSLVEPLSQLFPSLRLTQQDCYQPIIYAVQHHTLSMQLLFFYCDLFYVCIWWSLLNLLPIPPLDGAKALYHIIRKPVLINRVGFVLSVLLGVLCLIQLYIFTALICAYLAYNNLRYMRATER